ncbi:MAG: DUF4105 domain-containing protein [SAR324 cluster bacterium]|nr:DUF4105 domain-containing protein [SAR324 cluster bacterium]
MKRFISGIILILFSFPSFLQAENFFTYLENLQKIAQQRKLYEKQQWLRLLHYTPLKVEGESEIGDPRFFNARDGADHPAHELYETLEAIFDPVFERGNGHGICRFPARFYWLNQQLHFDPQYLPPVDCRSYNAWRKLIAAKSVSVVFASSYMGNPASVFGHTFLKFNQKKRNPSLNLLAHVVQFQAIVDDQIGVLYALKGLFGGYDGYYALNPYYTPILSNIEFEDRSIWEYELNLTTEELEILIMHSWEMANSYIPYYFTLENCSYRTLELIEIAAPQYPLKSPYHLWAIPATTVRDVIDQKGLFAKMNYFPARTRQLLQKFNTLTDAEKDILLTLVEQPEWVQSEAYSLLPDERKGLILDTALDYLRSRLNENQDDLESEKKRRYLLRVRSRLKNVMPAQLPLTQEKPLQDGHSANRVRLGIGGNREGVFQEFAIWPAYHDILADESGHLENSQLSVLDVRVRRYPNNEWTMHQLDMTNVISLTPLSLIRSDWSWRVKTSVEPSTKRMCRVCRKVLGQVGLGYSWEIHYWKKAVSYFMGNVTAEVDTAYHYDYMIGTGMWGGVLLEWTPQWKSHLEIQTTQGLLGDPHYYINGKIHQRWTLNQNKDLRVELNFGHFGELLMALNFYY